MLPRWKHFNGKLSNKMCLIYGAVWESCPPALYAQIPMYQPVFLRGVFEMWTSLTCTRQPCKQPSKKQAILTLAGPKFRWSTYVTTTLSPFDVFKGTTLSTGIQTLSPNGLSCEWFQIVLFFLTGNIKSYGSITLCQRQVCPQKDWWRPSRFMVISSIVWANVSMSSSCSCFFFPSWKLCDNSSASPCAKVWVSLYKPTILRF